MNDVVCGSEKSSLPLATEKSVPIIVYIYRILADVRWISIHYHPLCQSTRPVDSVSLELCAVAAAACSEVGDAVTDKQCLNCSVVKFRRRD